MPDLDERTVLTAGGWDARYAVVRAVRTLGDRAAAVVDANGDGADIDLEHFARSDGEWRLLSSSGGAGDWGRGWCDGMWAEHDRDPDRGWWLTLEPGPPDDDRDEPPRGSGTTESGPGWTVWVPDEPGLG